MYVMVVGVAMLRYSEIIIKEKIRKYAAFANEIVCVPTYGTVHMMTLKKYGQSFNLARKTGYKFSKIKRIPLKTIYIVVIHQWFYSVNP